MSEIKLNRRYPESRLEDVTDAYMRGFEVGLAMRADENSELRELVRNVEHYERFGCRGCPHSGSCGAGTLYAEDCAMSLEIERGKRELGIEADA